MMQVTTLEHGRYQTKNWNIGEPVPDIFPMHVLQVRLTDKELAEYRLAVEFTNAFPGTGLTLKNGQDAKETTWYGDDARFIFGNMNVWAFDTSDEDDDEDDDEDTDDDDGFDEDYAWTPY